MQKADFDNLEFSGFFLSFEEGQEAIVKFLTGFWYFDKGEEDFSGMKARYPIWAAKVCLWPSTEEKQLVGTQGLLKVLKREMTRSGVTLDDLESKQPKFHIRRIDKYTWDVSFKGYDQTKVDAGNDVGIMELENEIEEELDENILSEVEEVILAELEGKKELKKSKLVPLVMYKLELDQKKAKRYIDQALKDNLADIDLRGDTITYKVVVNEDEIQNNMVEMIKANDGKFNIRDLKRLMMGAHNIDETTFNNILKSTKDLAVIEDTVFLK